MKRLEQLSTSRKILLMVLLITSLSLVLAGGFLGVYERHHAKQSMVGELRILAQVVADRSTAAMLFGDKKVAEENLAALAANPAIDAACLYTGEGDVFTRFHRRCECFPVFADEPYLFQGGMLHVQQAVMLDARVLGRLVISANLSDLNARTFDYLAILSALLLGVVVFAGLLAMRMQRLISAPIERLVATAEQVSSTHDYSYRAQARAGDETGRLVVAFNSMLQAISERDEALGESEARYRNLLEGVSAVIYTASLEMPPTLLYLSPQVERILGGDQMAWLDNQSLFFDHIHPQDKPRVLQALADARKEQKPFVAEYRFLRPDGSIAWCRDEADLVFSVEGRPMFYHGLIHDITEAYETRQALQFRLDFERVVEQVSRRFIDCSQDSLEATIDWSLAQAGELVEAGRAYLFRFEDDGLHVSNTHEWCAPQVSAHKHELQQLRIEDYSALFEALNTQRFYLLEDVADLPDTQKTFRDTLQRQGIRSLVNVPVSWDNKLWGFLGFDAIGKPGAWRERDVDLLCIISEVMASSLQRLQAQEALRLLNAELERRVKARTAELSAANQEMEAFTYSVSHDLRSPLLVLDGFSQALLEDYAQQLDPEARRYLGYLRQGSQELGGMIDGLLSLSRATRGEKRREWIDLSAMAQACIDELRASEPERQVTAEIAEGLSGYGDSRLIRSVMVNLIGNAWKYTSHTAQASIEFGLSQEMHKDMFFVRDNGAGFDIDYAEKLFQPFQRMHRADEFPGTGIGLATVKRIIRRHGGDVWAEAAVGEGATFYFNLPDLEMKG